MLSFHVFQHETYLSYPHTSLSMKSKPSYTRYYGESSKSIFPHHIHLIPPYTHPHIPIARHHPPPLFPYLSHAPSTALLSSSFLHIHIHTPAPHNHPTTTYPHHIHLSLIFHIALLLLFHYIPCFAHSPPFYPFLFHLALRNPPLSVSDSTCQTCFRGNVTRSRSYLTTHLHPRSVNSS